MANRIGSDPRGHGSDWCLLEAGVECTGRAFRSDVLNPEHIQALSGKKYDRRDASHLADLLQHGLLQGSFIPPVEIWQLRDLTRNRARTVQEAARIKNRIQKILERRPMSSWPVWLAMC